MSGTKRHRARWSAPHIVPTHAVGTCPACGKQRYRTRSVARAAARRLYPDDALRAYMCGDWWHIGHTTTWRKRGTDR